MFPDVGNWRTLALVGVALAVPLLTGPLVAEGAGAVQPETDAAALGAALTNNAPWFVGAQVVKAPTPQLSTGLVQPGAAGSFPSTPGIILSTGNVKRLNDPNNSPASADDLAGLPSRGDTDYDATVLRVDVNVPAGTNCLTGLQFQYFSEEYPEFINTEYNDAFVAEIDKNTWSTKGSDILAPDNFLTDAKGNLISINLVGPPTMTPANAAGTTFDGATPVLKGASPITPGAHSIYFSIFDQGDGDYDSAVIIDGLQFIQVTDPAKECIPGVEAVVPPPPTTAAPTTVAPTTVAPTTAAPTTVAPTTVAPTTAAPTTVAPTTTLPAVVVPVTTAAPPTTQVPTEAVPATGTNVKRGLLLGTAIAAAGIVFLSARRRLRSA